MNISSISSTSTTQSLSDILAAQLQAAKLRKQAADKQSSTTVSTQDSAQFSPEALQASKDSRINPLDSLVSKGTITKDQESLIASALQSSMQAQFGSQSQTGTTSTTK